MLTPRRHYGTFPIVVPLAREVTLRRATTPLPHGHQRGSLAWKPTSGGRRGAMRRMPIGFEIETQILGSHTVGFIAQVAQVSRHGEPCLGEIAIIVIRQTMFLTGLTNDMGYRRIAIDGNRGKQMMFDLVIEASREPIPPERASRPICRRRHLLVRPVTIAWWISQIFLNVIDNENILEILCSDAHEKEAVEQGAPQSVEVP